MAIWFDKYEQNGTQASIRCDSTEDLPNLREFATEHSLKVGSDCFCQSDYTVHFMNSDGSWT